MEKLNKTLTQIFGLLDELEYESRKWRPGPDFPTAILCAQFVKSKPGSKYLAYVIGGSDLKSVLSEESFAIFGMKYLKIDGFYMYT